MTAEIAQEPYDHHRGKLPLMRPARPWRLVVFLGMTFAGFVVVNAFWQYLGSGLWIDLAPASYWHDLTTPLGESFTCPLSVLAYKWMIPVNGVLLALVVFVPLIVAVLYRLVYAMLFVLVVGAVGHAPALALTLALGCFLAGRTPLRSDMPFLAFVLGMLPPGLYLLGLSMVGVEPAALPLDQMLLKAPLVVALVAAIVAAVVVLELARLLRYKPGVVWPVLAALLTVPMVVFYMKIGADELQYELLMDNVLRDDSIFEDTPLETWRAQNHAQSMNSQMLLNRLQDDLEMRKRELLGRCDSFLWRYGQGNRAADVLWIGAQCQSLQVNAKVLDDGIVRYSAAYPLGESKETWRQLADQHIMDPSSALALERLGELDLREGNIRQGLEKLGKAEIRLRQVLARGSPSRPAETPPQTRALPTLDYYKLALMTVQRLRWMVISNHIEQDPYGTKALMDYLNTNPCQADYADRLEELVEVYSDSAMADNLRLALAKATGDSKKQLELLTALASQGPSDASVEANFELGKLALGRGDATTMGSVPLKSPREYFNVVASAPTNPWRELVRAWLRRPDKPKGGT